MKRFQILIIVSIVTFIWSCDVPEHYFKPEPECKSEISNSLNKENQKNLIDKLKTKRSTDYRYFFKTFEEEGSNTFMITNFRDEESCFDVKILVDKLDKLAGMKRTNGVSYPNELYDLKWEVKSINDTEMVRYVDMRKIID